MKVNILISVAVLFFAFSNCKKEETISGEPEIEQIDTTVVEPAIPPLGCDDTTLFKSSVDLEPLVFLYDCFLSTATKEVPGLGSIPWTANCSARLIQDKLHFDFSTYEQYFDELLPRENLFCGYVPISTGYYPVYDSYHYTQNIGTSFGYYARLLDDGDVADASWDTDTTCVNFIEITQLDLEDKEVRGNFELHLKMVHQGQNGILYSERINFNNGKFYARIFEY